MTREGTDAGDVMRRQKGEKLRQKGSATRVSMDEAGEMEGAEELNSWVLSFTAMVVSENLGPLRRGGNSV